MTQLVLYKTWRSEYFGVVLFFVKLFGAVALSRLYPGSVIHGPLFSIAGMHFALALPLYWLAPFGWLVLLAVRIYDVRYLINERGIEGYEGILSLSRTITQVRYEDVRSIETDQTLIERFLGVGDVLVGTAAKGSIELVLYGVAAPREVQEFIQNERDQRREAEQSSTEFTAGEVIPSAAVEAPEMVPSENLAGDRSMAPKDS